MCVNEGEEICDQRSGCIRSPKSWFWYRKGSNENSFYLFFLKPRKSYSTLLDQWPQPWAVIKDLPWPRDLVTLLPQLHSRDKITCLQPVVWAVSSVRFSSVMLESWLETTIFIFTTGKRGKGELKFRVESTQQGGSVYPASGDQTENEVSGRLTSLKHFPLDRGDY